MILLHKQIHKIWNTIQNVFYKTKPNGPRKINREYKIVETQFCSDTTWTPNIRWTNTNGASARLYTVKDNESRWCFLNSHTHILKKTHYSNEGRVSLNFQGWMTQTTTDIKRRSTSRTYNWLIWVKVVETNGLMFSTNEPLCL